MQVLCSAKPHCVPKSSLDDFAVVPVPTRSLYHTLVYRLNCAALQRPPRRVTSAVLNGAKGQLTLGFHCDVSQQCYSR